MSDEISRLKEKKKDLEHEIFEQKLKGIKGQLVAMGDTLHMRMTDSEEKSEIEFNHIKKGLEEIKGITKDTLNQVKETNGRVSDLEKNEIVTDINIENLKENLEDVSKCTRVVRFMHKYPTITTFSVLIAYLFSIKEIRDVTFDYIIKFFLLFGKLL